MKRSSFRVRIRQARCLIVAAAAAVSLPASLTAQVPGAATRPSFTAASLSPGESIPDLDGRVTDAVWLRVSPFTSFTQQDPQEGQPSSENTEVRLLFTPTHMFVGVICFDRDPSRIIVSQARRDASLTDTDSIVMVFDTFNDSQNAFVFGTNALGIQYDGQVAREGQTSGLSAPGGGTGGTQRGGISSFNPNWDGDWSVRAAVTERGWEAEMAIPLKTLRYAVGADRTWGFNVLRNIRHKNEQAFLAPIPRGFDIYRVSMAAKVGGITLGNRRDVKLTPYGLASTNTDYARTLDQTKKRVEVGADLKWGIRPNLTFDGTVNTDFAQVEADEEQINLTRFDLFFPEKRPFFLENASTFQFGQPQSVDLFFSRRIGLSSAGAPIDILGGTRLSGKVAGGWNVGLLNVQTDEALDADGKRVAPSNNFSVVRAQREVGRSTFGGIFVGKLATSSDLAGQAKWNRAYGVDADVAVSPSQRVSAFLARTDSPGATGSDSAGRVFYNFTNPLWQVSGGVSQVGERFNPEVGFLPRRGYRRPELRVSYQVQPKGVAWIRRVSPHMSLNAYYDLSGNLQSSTAHLHFFEIQPARGGRFGWAVDRSEDHPGQPFRVYERDGRRVAVDPGAYAWWQHNLEYQHNPSAAFTGSLRVRTGRYYNGDFTSVEVSNDYRIGARLTASLGWTRQDVELPNGAFVTNLVPVKANYAFTPLASLSALLQYNGQTAQFSSNVRLALLTRGGTGLFVVYNDRRDLTEFTPLEALGRSLVVKYTRLFDF